jgi:hypothetical protein
MATNKQINKINLLILQKIGRLFDKFSNLNSILNVRKIKYTDLNENYIKSRPSAPHSVAIAPYIIQNFIIFIFFSHFQVKLNIYTGIL